MIYVEIYVLMMSRFIRPITYKAASTVSLPSRGTELCINVLSMYLFSTVQRTLHLSLSVTNPTQPRT